MTRLPDRKGVSVSRSALSPPLSSPLRLRATLPQLLRLLWCSFCLAEQLTCLLALSIAGLSLSSARRDLASLLSSIFLRLGVPRVCQHISFLLFFSFPSSPLHGGPHFAAVIPPAVLRAGTGKTTTPARRGVRPSNRQTDRQTVRTELSRGPSESESAEQ